MAKLLTLLIAFLCIVVATTAKDCGGFKNNGWYMNVVNEMLNEPKIQVRCASKDDDLGMKALGWNEGHHWKFCDTLLGLNGATVFWCHFYWGNKEQRFEVFNTTMRHQCNEVGKDYEKPYWRCTWMIRHTGFWFRDRRKGSDKPRDYKWYDWKVGRIA
uniref:S-protein homolog 20-like n=1 Tax=Erigeron canadensis TaxID=72917 RepID=UPI001CB966E5|nr:S-protein homolog 20-like [Erigeron canadensis]